MSPIKQNDPSKMKKPYIRKTNTDILKVDKTKTAIEEVK